MAGGQSAIEWGDLWYHIFRFSGSDFRKPQFLGPNKTRRKESSAPIPAARGKKEVEIRKRALGRGYAEHFCQANRKSAPDGIIYTQHGLHRKAISAFTESTKQSTNKQQMLYELQNTIERSGKSGVCIQIYNLSRLVY